MRKEVNLETSDITELEDAPAIKRTNGEIEAVILQNKIQEANSYLKETDWVETYKIKHELGLNILPLESSKWLVINKRESYKLFLKNLEGIN